MKCNKCGRTVEYHAWDDKSIYDVTFGYNLCKRCFNGGVLISGNYVRRREQLTLEGWNNHGQ